MQIRNTLMTLLCMSLPLFVQAQTDSSAIKRKISKSKKPVNVTRLELVYKSRTIQTFHTAYDLSRTGSNGGIRSYEAPTTSTIEVRYIRINDRELKRLDRRGDILRPYYAKAPLANEQLRLMNRERRIGALEGWPLVGVGTGFTFAGLGAAASKLSENDNSNPSIAKAFVYGIPGLAMIAGGILLRRYHNKKADSHLERSLEIYNMQYYKPVKPDTTVKRAGNTDSAALKSLIPIN